MTVAFSITLLCPTGVSTSARTITGHNCSPPCDVAVLNSAFLHNMLKVFLFGIRLCLNLILNKPVSKSLNFGPNWQFLYFKHISSAFFVTIATVKVRKKPGYYTWVILLINPLDGIMKHNFQFLAQNGAKFCPLMHVALYFAQRCRKKKVKDVSLVLKGSATDSANLSSLIRLSVSDSQKR